MNSHTSKPVPLLAQTALKQAEVIAHNVVADVSGKRRKKYTPHIKGVILPLGGRHAVWNLGNNFFRGAWVWALRRGIDLWYWMSIIGPLNGLRKWWHDTSVFVRND